MESSDKSNLIEFKLQNLEELSKKLEENSKLLEFKKTNLLVFKQKVAKSTMEKISELVQLKESSLEKTLQVIETEYI